MELAGRPLTLRHRQLRVIDRPEGSGSTSEWVDVQVSGLVDDEAMLAIRDDSVRHMPIGFRDQLGELAVRLDKETDLGEPLALGFLPNETGPNAVLARYLTSLAMRYLRGLEDLRKLNPVLADRLARELADFANDEVRWYSRQLTLVGVRPTSEFTHKNVVIRQLTPPEKGRLLEGDLLLLHRPSIPGDYIPPNFPHHVSPDALLDVRTSRPRSKPQDDSRLIQRIVLAFFLKGFALHGYGDVIGFDLPLWASGGSYLNQPLAATGWPAERKTLGLSEFKAVVDLGYRIPDFTSNETNQQEIALDRLLKACGAGREASGFLDFVIALEASLLGGVERELAYRFSLYGALFLADERDPQETFKRLRNVYSVRSKIVHGSPVPAAHRKTATSDASELAKAVVLRAIESGWPRPSDLDRRALAVSLPKRPRPNS